MKINYLLVFFSGWVLWACEPPSPYEKVVQEELATGIRNDSLFYDFYFGMPSADFFAYCWEKNKTGEFTSGGGNTMVQTEIQGLPYRANMQFYPLFLEDKIQSMTLNFSYVAWSPWHKHLSAESLLEDVRVLFEVWYGGEFFEVNSIGWGKTYVMIQGNRRVVVYYQQENRVDALISDLTNEDDLLNTENF